MTVLPVKVAQSCRTLGTPWTVAHKAPLSMDFPGKNAGVSDHFLLHGISLTPGIKLPSPALLADSLPSELAVNPT